MEIERIASKKDKASAGYKTVAAESESTAEWVEGGQRLLLKVLKRQDPDTKTACYDFYVYLTLADVAMILSEVSTRIEKLPGLPATQ